MTCDRHSDSMRKILMLTRYDHQECGQHKSKMIAVSKIFTICLNSPKTRVLCYTRPRRSPWNATQKTTPRDNVPLVRMVKKKENAIPGQVFSFMLCQRNVTSSFYCTFSSSRPCASCQTRQHNKRKLVHNKDLKRHAQRPNFYHMSCLRNLLYIWGAVAHICTV